jgi:hypothetical protein
MSDTPVNVYIRSRGSGVRGATTANTELGTPVDLATVSNQLRRI